MIEANHILDRGFLEAIRANMLWYNTYIPALIEHLEKNNVEVRVDSRESADILHLHFTGPLAYRMLRRQKGSPTVLHGPRRQKGAPVVFHGHATDETFGAEAGRGRRWITKRFLHHLTMLFARKADAIICPSEYSSQYYREHVTAPVVTIPYGVDSNRFRFSEKKRKEFRERFGIGDEFVVLTVGGIARRKGILDFLELARRFPDARFVWAGDFYMSEGVARGFSGFSLGHVPENVIFTGKLTDVESIYSICDVFFFPSYQETQGLPLGEAACCGRQILTRDIPVFREWLTPGVNCRMASDVPGFARELKHLMEREEEFGRNAREKALEVFDPDNTAKRIVQAYEDLLEGGG